MTITNEPTTAIPPWIDLDQIIPSDLRAEARAQVETMKAFLADCVERARSYQSVLERTHAAFEAARVSDVDPDLGGLFTTLREELGVDALEDIGWLVGMMFSPDPNSTPTQDYLVEAAVRQGVIREMASASDTEREVGE